MFTKYMLKGIKNATFWFMSRLQRSNFNSSHRGREEWSFELFVNSLGMARGWFGSTLLLHLRSIDIGGG